MSNEPSQQRILIGRILTCPHMLIWVALLPQLLLLALNLRGYNLVSGEMNEEQVRSSMDLFTYGLFLLAFNAILSGWLMRKKQALTWIWNIPVLLVHIGYLWLFTARLHDLLPASVTMWILPPGQLLYYQYALMMPVLFYAATRLACFPTSIHAPMDVGATVLAAVGIPVFCFVFVNLFMRFLDDLFMNIPGTLLFIMLVAMTVAVLTGIIRLLVMLYNLFASRIPAGPFILALLAGLVLPLCGLLLNRSVPFPVDFQSTGVYLLTLVNGVVLLIPATGRPRIDRAVWLGRCVLFPFTLYFFMVFLPFLPLSLLAIVAMGTGFLMLTPTLLFVIHLRIMVDGFKQAAVSGKGQAVLVMILALLILPGFYTQSAFRDRDGLREAIDFVYSPDYRTTNAFKKNSAVVKRSLENLRDFKAGLNLPFLSGYYNAIVFGGLVLPDEKMQHIHRTFFGTELEPAEEDTLGVPDLFGGGRSRRTGFTRTLAAPPPTEVVKLTDLRFEQAEEAHANKTLLSLTMKNTSSRQAEFATTLRIPDGVLISGFWLYIEGKREPGRLFEKKSAMWVYQMIRDVTRRDPGLLVYQTHNQVSLRVFPFEGQQTRKVEIELLYPPALSSAVHVGERTLFLNTGAAGKDVTAVSTPRGTAVVLPGTALEALPSLRRTPYLHFLIDRSREATSTLPESLNRCARITERFPGIKQCMVTLANYESFTLTDQPIPIADLRLLAHQRVLPARGGFCIDRSIRHLVKPALQNTPGAYPVFVAVKDPNTLVVRDDEPFPIRHWLADTKVFYLSDHDGNLKSLRFDNLSEQPFAFTRGEPVSLLRQGEHIRPCAVGGRDSAIVFFPDHVKPESDIQVYNPSAKGFVPLPNLTVVPADSRYGLGLQAWLANVSLREDPSKGLEHLPQVVKLSRASGVQVPATSYIVVENSAQWKMLERAENKKLDQAQALEFMETPEPAGWLLLLGFLAFLLLRHRFKRCHPARNV